MPKNRVPWSEPAARAKAKDEARRWHRIMPRRLRRRGQLGHDSMALSERSASDEAMMATIPRISKRPQSPKPPPVSTYTYDQMKSWGWISEGPSRGNAVPRTPDPRIPAGEDPRIPRKDETS